MSPQLTSVFQNADPAKVAALRTVAVDRLALTNASISEAAANLVVSPVNEQGRHWQDDVADTRRVFSLYNLHASLNVLNSALWTGTFAVNSARIGAGAGLIAYGGLLTANALLMRTRGRGLGKTPDRSMFQYAQRQAKSRINQTSIAIFGGANVVAATTLLVSPSPQPIDQLLALGGVSAASLLQGGMLFGNIGATKGHVVASLNGEQKLRREAATGTSEVLSEVQMGTLRAPFRTIAPAVRDMLIETLSGTSDWQQATEQHAEFVAGYNELVGKNSPYPRITSHPVTRRGKAKRQNLLNNTLLDDVTTNRVQTVTQELALV